MSWELRANEGSQTPVIEEGHVTTTLRSGVAHRLINYNIYYPS